MAVTGAGLAALLLLVTRAAAQPAVPGPWAQPPPSPAPAAGPLPDYPLPAGSPAAGYPQPGNPPPYAQPGPGYPRPVGSPPAGIPLPYAVEPSREPPGFETHDGVYLRMQLGFGAATLSGRNSSGGNIGMDTVEYSGSSVSMAIALGYAVAPNLVLYVEALAAGQPEADVKTAHTDFGITTTSDFGRTSFATNVFAIGPGVAYYFGPNLFAATSFLLAQATVEDGHGHRLAESRAGFAFAALLGKEWWVSANWALGASLQLLRASMKGKDLDPIINSAPSWRASGFAVLFSATYN